MISRLNRLNRSWVVALVVAGLAIADAAVVVTAANYRPATWDRTPRLAYIEALRPSDDRPQVQADAVSSGAKEYFVKNGAVTIPPGDAALHGWAIDQTTHAPFGALLMALDRAPFVPVAYGGSRPDVAAALNCPPCAASGYRIAFERDELRRGRHTVRLRFVAAGMTSYVDAAPLTITVR